MTKPEPRKRLFVNRAIQGHLLARTALYWMLYHGVLWMAMFFCRYAEHRGAVQAGASPRTFNELYSEFTHDNLSLWVCSLAILPVVLWDLLTVSHRIVGPLVRFQRTLESLTAGDPIAPVTLRKGDLLHDLQDSFNQYLSTLETMQPESAPLMLSTATLDPLADAFPHADELEDTLAFDLRPPQPEVTNELSRHSQEVPQTVLA